MEYGEFYERVAECKDATVASGTIMKGRPSVVIRPMQRVCAANERIGVKNYDTASYAFAKIAGNVR